MSDIDHETRSSSAISGSCFTIFRGYPSRFNATTPLPPTLGQLSLFLFIQDLSYSYNRVPKPEYISMLKHTG